MYRCISRSLDGTRAALRLYVLHQTMTAAPAKRGGVKSQILEESMNWLQRLGLRLIFLILNIFKYFFCLFSLLERHSLHYVCCKVPVFAILLMPQATATRSNAK